MKFRKRNAAFFVGEGFNPPERKFTPRWGEFPSDMLWMVQKSAHRGRIFDREGWKTLPY